MNLVCYATPQDHDIMRGFMKDCAPTLSAAAGHSGNNKPFFCRTNRKSQGIVEGAHGVTMQPEVGSCVAGSGGKPGQGYAAVLVTM